MRNRECLNFNISDCKFLVPAYGCRTLFRQLVPHAVQRSRSRINFCVRCLPSDHAYAFHMVRMLMRQQNPVHIRRLHTAGFQSRQDMFPGNADIHQKRRAARTHQIAVSRASARKGTKFKSHTIPLSKRFFFLVQRPDYTTFSPLQPAACVRNYEIIMRRRLR